MGGVYQPIISEAFITLDQFDTLAGYRLYDVLAGAYVNDGTIIWFRGDFYTLMGEDGYLYTKVGFAMATNPFIMDPMNFLTPVYMNGMWQSSYMVMKGGRPMRVDVYGDSYPDTWNQLITSYVNTVVPG